MESSKVTQSDEFPVPSPTSNRIDRLHRFTTMTSTQKTCPNLTGLMTPSSGDSTKPTCTINPAAVVGASIDVDEFRLELGNVIVSHPVCKYDCSGYGPRVTRDPYARGAVPPRPTSFAGAEPKPRPPGRKRRLRDGTMDWVRGEMLGETLALKL